MGGFYGCSKNVLHPGGMLRECLPHPGHGYGAAVPAGRMRMDMPFPL